jgi:hypothetical protein
MDKFSKYIDTIVNKALSEAVEKRAEELVSEVSKKMETTEKLHGKQSKIDVAEPKGKITAADFKKLRAKKDMKEYTMGDVEPDMDVEPYGNFDTEKVKVGKVKNVGYGYEKKIGKEFNEEEAIEGNKFSGARAKALKMGDSSFEVDGKVYPVKGETDEARDKFDGRKSKVIGVYSDIKKQRMEEKWEGDVEVKQTGQYADMSIEELNDGIKKLKSQNEKYKEEGKKVPEKNKTKMSQLYFAKRAKQGWKGKGKAKVAESFRLTEDELVDLIEKIVMEQKSKNLKEYEKKEPTVAPMQNKIDSRQEEINQDHIKATAEKMNKYLKTGSNEKYNPNPTHFPEGNGELKKMDKKAYIPSDAVEEYLDAFAFPGMTNLVYDEIKPNDEWIKANIEGSSKTGNAEVDEEGKPLGNVVPSKTGKKFYKNYQDNIYGGEQMNASYKRYPQPVDQSGEDVESGDMKTKKGALGSEKIFKALGESVDEKKQKKINEEIEKMKKIVGYNQKTQ